MNNRQRQDAEANMFVIILTIIASIALGILTMSALFGYGSTSEMALIIFALVTIGIAIGFIRIASASQAIWHIIVAFAAVIFLVGGLTGLMNMTVATFSTIGLSFLGLVITTIDNNGP